MKWVLFAVCYAALMVSAVACGTDQAECGGVISSGSITNSTFSSNCANGNAGSAGAGTTDRHDVTDNHSTTGGSE